MQRLIKSSSRASLVSDAAVQAKTGKTWAEWLRLLDAAGARQMDHKAIVAHLNQHHAIGPWWQQMVTVNYEQARGLRDKHQKPSGYEISVSKTFAVPVAKVFRTWENGRTRARWLVDADKSLRITWGDGKTDLHVNFIAKGADKTQVTATHGKLTSARQATKMKKYWAANLARLGEILAA